MDMAARDSERLYKSTDHRLRTGSFPTGSATIEDERAGRLVCCKCQPDGFLLLSRSVLYLPKSCCSVGPTEAFPVELLAPWPRLTSRLAVVVAVAVVVQLVPRSWSLLPFQASFSLVPIQASTEPQDRPTQCGSFEQGLVVRQFVPQRGTGTHNGRNVTRASES